MSFFPTGKNKDVSGYKSDYNIAGLDIR